MELEHVKDWHRLAEEELGETPAVRETSLADLRCRLKKLQQQQQQQQQKKTHSHSIGLPEITTTRAAAAAAIDNRFLLRFLRVDKFDVACAFKRLQRYEQLREKMIPCGTVPSDFRHVYARQLTTVLQHYDSQRRRVFVARVGYWDAHCGFTLADTYAPDVFMLEHTLADDETQVRGLVAIVDMKGFSIWHLQQAGFGHIRVLVHTVQDAFPARFKAIHVVNQPGLYDYIYACIRPFLKPKIVKRIHLHGSDMKSLHEHIDPEILPEEYGGSAGPFSNDWICQQLYERDEEFRNYSHYGFARDVK